MLGTELKEYGKLVDNKELMLVHLHLSEGKTVPPHDHKGQDIYFTVVKGKMQVTLNSSETHELTPGSVLTFAGEADIAVRAMQDSEAFIYLINRQK